MKQLRLYMALPLSLTWLLLARLGSLLSKVRFSYIGMRPEEFSQKIIGEVMGTLTPDGRTMLWDHLGRRFINLSYNEADAFSRTSKEFITSLFPEVEIYASLLPAEARRLIGHVSPDAVPALRMLERLGFHHNDEVDPFDGGPYLEAHRDQIPLVKSTRGGAAQGGLDESAQHPIGIVCMQKGADFRAVRCPFLIDGDVIRVSDKAMDVLQLTSGMSLSATPLEQADVGQDRASRGSINA